jgi:hypothetical protein
MEAIASAYTAVKACSFAVDLSSFWAEHQDAIVTLAKSAPAGADVSQLASLIAVAAQEAPDLLGIREELLLLLARGETCAFLSASRDACSAFSVVSDFWLQLVRAVELCGFVGGPGEAARAAALASVAPAGATAASLPELACRAVLHVGSDALQQVFPSATSYAEVMLEVLRVLQRAGRAGGDGGLPAQWVSHCFTFLDTYYPQWAEAYVQLLDAWARAAAVGGSDSCSVCKAAQSLADRAFATAPAAAPEAAARAWPVSAIATAATACIRATASCRDAASARRIARACMASLAQGSPADAMALAGTGQTVVDLVRSVEREWASAEAALGDAASAAEVWQLARLTRDAVDAAAKSAALHQEVAEGGDARGKKRKRARGALESSPAAPPAEQGGGDDEMSEEGEGGGAQERRFAPTGLAGLMGVMGAAAGSGKQPAVAVAGDSSEKVKPATAPSKPKRTAEAFNDKQHHPRTVFLHGLPFKTVAGSVLRAAFGHLGQVVDARVALTKEGKGRGFGIVVFAEDSGREAALATEFVDVDGRSVHLQPCRPDIVLKWLADVDPEVAAAARSAAADVGATLPSTMFKPHALKRFGAAPKQRLDV